jgi:excisionase family DNA binding protein
VKDAARFLHISVAGLYAMMGRGELPFVKLGRSRRIPHRALVELAARNLIGGRDA